MTPNFKSKGHSRGVRVALITMISLGLFAIQSLGQTFFETNYDQFKKPKVRKYTFDYYNRNQDSFIKNWLRDVESGHLSPNNFEQKFRSQWYSGALDELSYVLSFFPNHPKALMLWSTISGIINKPTLPLPYYHRALQHFPQHAITHFQYGIYLVSIDKVDEGITALKNAIKIDSDLAAAHAALAEAYYKNGEIEQAIKEAKKA